MLLDKPTVTSTVMSVRLQTGEELVGRFVSEDDNVIVLNKILSVAIQQTRNGEAAIGFGPFMLSVDEDAQVPLYKNKMLVPPQKSRKDLADKYLELTSPIAMAKPSGLIRP